jgi:hypothetical protein
MPQAYDEASFVDTESAPARQVMYAVRRLSRLGDRLNSSYFLKKLLDIYLVDDAEETADCDIHRDARATFREPHRQRGPPRPPSRCASTSTGSTTTPMIRSVWMRSRPDSEPKR